MSVYASHQVDVDMACQPGEITGSKVLGQWHIRGNLRQELTAAGLFGRVLAMEGDVPRIRLYGQKGKLDAWLAKNEYRDCRVVRRPKANT